MPYLPELAAVLRWSLDDNAAWLARRYETAQSEAARLVDNARSLCIAVDVVGPYQQPRVLDIRNRRNIVVCVRLRATRLWSKSLLTELSNS